MHNILATETVVAPCGAPRRVYGLSVVAFGADGSIESIYRRLCAGERIRISFSGIQEYEKEKPSLLLSESPLLIEMLQDGEWYMSMP